MVGIFENIGESFKFGFRECYGDGFKGFLRMLALLITSIIPIVCFIPMGIFLKVYRGEKPDFTNAGQSFVRGLLYLVVKILYWLIPIILLIIFGGFGLFSALIGGDVGTGVGGVFGFLGIMIAVIAGIILRFIAIPAEINFARNGFEAAFKFSEIFGMISKAGFAKYILSFIVLIIVAIIIGIILFVILNIPVAGIILPIFLVVPLIFFRYRYWANFFAA